MKRWILADQCNGQWALQVYAAHVAGVSISHVRGTLSMGPRRGEGAGIQLYVAEDYVSSLLKSLRDQSQVIEENGVFYVEVPADAE